MKTTTRKSRVGPGRFIDARIWAASLVCLALPACKKPESVTLPPPVVEVMEIVTTEVPISVTLIGQLDSPQNVEIRARVEGFVDKMPFTEGVEVQKGDVLFELDKKPFLERLAAATGALGEAKAALNKYEKDRDRLAPLVARKAIPQQDLDNALASVDVGKAGVITAGARVESAQLDLGYCVIRSPVTGLIGAKQVSTGELVGKGEPTLLATISTLDPIWFYCNVGETDYIKAEARSKELGREIMKLPLSLVLAGSEREAGTGRFVFIDRAVDVKTGTIRIRAEFPNKEKVLRPGMFARAKVDLGTRKDSIVIPQRALSELQGKSFVWVVSEDGIASQRAVTPGELAGSDVVIEDGLKAGERIVLEGLQKVREGTPVNAMTAARIAAIKPSSPAETPAGDKH